MPGTVIAENPGFVVIEMSPEDWFSVPDHPRQRDTARHAKARHWREAVLAEGAVRSHLHHVTGAILNGVLYKVDGHTRAKLWQEGKLPLPERVFVTAYRVKSRQDFLDLYKVKDSISAADTAYDKITGALREQGYLPSSKQLTKVLTVNGLHIALRGVTLGLRSKKLREFDVYKAVSIMLPEIVMLDSLDPKYDVFKSGITAAALILFTLEKRQEMVEFFRRIGEKQGEKRNGKMDPVESVLSEIKVQEISKGRYHRSYLPSALAQVELCGRCIRAAENWLAGPNSPDYWRRYRPVYVDVAEYVQKVRKVKIFGEDDTL